MAERLAQQLKKVQSLQQQLDTPGTDQRQFSPEIAAVASDTARTMVNEVLDWRVIFQDRPLKTT